MIQFIVPLGQTLGQTGAGPHASYNSRHRLKPQKRASLGKTQEPIALMIISEESFDLISI